MFLVAKFRWPLRRGENRPLLVHKFKKVELLIVSQGLGIVHECSVVGSAAARSQGHAHRSVAACDGLYTMSNLVASPVELTPELRDQRCRLIFICPLKGSSRNGRHDPGHGAHGKKNRQREHQQEFAPKVQGFSVPSHTFCNGHSPSRRAVQSLTPAPSATGLRK